MFSHFTYCPICEFERILCRKKNNDDPLCRSRKMIFSLTTESRIHTKKISKYNPKCALSNKEHFYFVQIAQTDHRIYLRLSPWQTDTNVLLLLCVRIWPMIARFSKRKPMMYIACYNWLRNHTHIAIYDRLFHVCI